MGSCMASKTGKRATVESLRRVPEFGASVVSFLMVCCLSLISEGTARAQLDDNCAASVLNRVVQINPDGTFVIPNVPLEPGLFRVRVTCVDGEDTRNGQSDFFALPTDAILEVTEFDFDNFQPPPVSVDIAAPTDQLTGQDEQLQLSATAVLAGGSTTDVTQADAGTFWSSSNTNIASVSANGLVTARTRGQAIIQARNEGVLASFALDVLIPNDADGDGLTDEFEVSRGLDPNDPSDAAQDRDGDGLSNLQEFELGTNIDAADTDGDGIPDGEELALGTDPLSSDTDGDGLLDGQEVQLIGPA